MRCRVAALHQHPQLAGTGFSPRQALADLGMVSTRVEGQLPGDRSAYRFRPEAGAGEGLLCGFSSGDSYTSANSSFT